MDSPLSLSLTHNARVLENNFVRLRFENKYLQM